jgi:hypothetical protein
MKHSHFAFLAAALLALGMSACDKKSDDAPSVGKGSTPAASAAIGEPAPAATQEPPKAAADDSGAMGPNALNEAFKADKGKWEKKEVRVKGFFMGSTTQGDQVNVSVYNEAAISADSVLCVFAKDDAEQVTKLFQKNPLTVTGVVDGTFFDKVKLKDCKKAD